MSKNYFIFDKNKCVGCEACVVACINENGFQEPELWRNIHSSNPDKLPGLPLFYLSMSCNHCDDAPCMDNCPALAYSRSPITGAILHSPDACIGCKYCTWNCPYDAPKYNPISGIINKCNLCESRLIDNQKPACASLCPTGALDFSFDTIDNLEIPQSINVPVHTNPSVVIKELVNTNGPRIDQSLFKDIKESKPTVEYKDKITASSEWTLVLFSLICAIMVAITSLDIIGDQSSIIKILFIGAGALAAGLSMFHLGKPLRAWRAMLNIKKSWLSREIISFTLYFGFTFIDLFIFNLPNELLLLFGFTLLLSIDALYRPAQLFWKFKIHSAQVLLIALSCFLLVNNLQWFFIIVMIFRLGLFIFINIPFDFKAQFSSISKLVRILSIVSTIIFIMIDAPLWFSLIIFTIGEIADRINFYDILEVPDIERALDS